MKKFLITGFSGFVSRHFIEYLEDNEMPSLVKGIDVHDPDTVQGILSMSNMILKN